MAVVSLGQGGFFRRQTLVGGSGIALQLVGMRQILPQLDNSPLCFAQGDARGLLLTGDLLLRNAMTFQNGAGVRFGFPQRGQRGGCLGGVGGSGRCGVRCGSHGHFRIMQGGGGLRANLLHAGALQRQKLCLRCPDRAGDVAVAAGLTGLALEAAELALQLGAEVLGAGQIGLGRAQLQFRLMSARVQAGDVGGFLQDRAALLRPGADESTDTALTDHSGRARP